MSLRRIIMLAGGLLVVAGCQAREEAPRANALAVAPVEERFGETDCPAQRCAEVVVNALRFPDAPALSDRLRTRLFVMAQGITDGRDDSGPADSWAAYARAFFEQAAQERRLASVHGANQAYLEAKVRARHDDLLVIELDSYVYHAGQAHGMPLTEFMVIDERQGRVVTLDDMLLDGQDAAFQAALARAHERWLQERDADDDFVANWPLSESRNVAPLETAWAVGYNVYEIAPYAAGQPELRLPHEELEGIAAPRYLGAEE